MWHEVTKKITQRHQPGTPYLHLPLCVQVIKFQWLYHWQSWNDDDEKSDWVFGTPENTCRSSIWYAVCFIKGGMNLAMYMNVFLVWLCLVIMAGDFDRSQRQESRCLSCIAIQSLLRVSGQHVTAMACSNQFESMGLWHSSIRAQGHNAFEYTHVCMLCISSHADVRPPRSLVI